MESHFSTSALLPQYIYVRSPHDLRTPQGLADLEQMAQRVSQLPNIAAVRGITRPTGQPLAQAQLSFQAGQVGINLQNASTQISDRTNDLDALTGGADKLAASLAQVRDQIRSASGPMTELTATLNQVQQQLATATQLLDTIRGLANSNGTAMTLASSVVDSAGPMLRRVEQQSAMQRRPGVQRRPLPPRTACPGAKQRYVGRRANNGGAERAGNGAASERPVGNGRRQSASSGLIVLPVRRRGLTNCSKAPTRWPTAASG